MRLTLSMELVAAIQLDVPLCIEVRR